MRLALLLSIAKAWDGAKVGDASALGANVGASRRFAAMLVSGVEIAPIVALLDIDDIVIILDDNNIAGSVGLSVIGSDAFGVVVVVDVDVVAVVDVVDVDVVVVDVTVVAVALVD